MKVVSRKGEVSRACVSETYAFVFFAARPPEVPKPARELTPSCNRSRGTLRQANMVRPGERFRVREEVVVGVQVDMRRV